MACQPDAASACKPNAHPRSGSATGGGAAAGDGAAAAADGAAAGGGCAAQSAFERTLALTELGDGRFEARIDAGWFGPRAPNGGVLAALMVRAAQAQLGPGAPPPRTVSAHYLEAPAPGPVQLAVEVLRARPRVSACEVRLHHAGRLACQATVLCSAPRSQPQLALHRQPPAAPAPEQLAELGVVEAREMPPIFERLALRPAFGARPFAGAKDALAGGWIALRDDRQPLDAARLCALCDLWWPALFARLRKPNALPTILLTIHLRETRRPAHPPALARFVSSELREGHVEERGELWSADGRLLAESLQLAVLV
jgi:acyl-CoA thioesterase